MCINRVTRLTGRYCDLWFLLFFGCNAPHSKCVLYLLLEPSEQAYSISTTEIWEPGKLLSVSLFASVNPQGFLLPNYHFSFYSSPEHICSYALLPQLTWELSRVLSVNIEVYSAAKSYLNLLDI